MPRVEECRVLSLTDLVRGGALLSPVMWTWGNPDGEPVFAVLVAPDGQALRLSFVLADQPQISEQTVPLEPVEVLGGKVKRWFARCPTCQERCLKLYLPPGNRLFGCRSCLDLGYESSQTSSVSVRRLRKNPRECLAILHNRPDTLLGITQLHNAIRALPESPTGFKGAGKVDRARWMAAFLLDEP